MKMLGWFLLTLFLILTIRVNQIDSGGLGGYQDTTFTPDPSSTWIDHHGVRIYGLPGEVEYIGGLLDLVTTYDQDVISVDAPIPAEIFVKDELWSGGRPAWGIANQQDYQIAIKRGLSFIDGVESVFHECVHLFPG